MIMAATSHLAASNRLHQEESSYRHHQQRTNPLEHTGNLLLMMMITRNQMMSNVDSKSDGEQRYRMRKGCGQPHHDRMPKAAFSVQQVHEHGRLAMARFKSMQGPKKKAQAKAQFVRMRVNVHTGRIPANVGSETSGTQ